MLHGKHLVLVWLNWYLTIDGETLRIPFHKVMHSCLAVPLSREVLAHHGLHLCHLLRAHPFEVSASLFCLYWLGWWVNFGRIFSICWCYCTVANNHMSLDWRIWSFVFYCLDFFLLTFISSLLLCSIHSSDNLLRNSWMKCH